MLLTSYFLFASNCNKYSSSITGLTWAVKNCDNMTELIKMDDDIFVHLPAFLEKARRNKPENQQLWMLGRLQVVFFYKKINYVCLSMDQKIFLLTNMSPYFHTLIYKIYPLSSIAFPCITF